MEAGQTAYQGMVEFSEFYNQLFKKTMYTRNKFPMDLSKFNNSYLFIKNQIYISSRIA